MPYELPPLPYDYDALAPTIDEQTMRIHHDKHHQAYVDNLNKAVEGTDLDGIPIEELVQQLDRLPEDRRTAARNNGGGHVNHSLFWQIMKPGGGGDPSGALAGAIESAFGSADALRAQLNDAGVKRFGSGWAWLVVNGSVTRGDVDPEPGQPADGRIDTDPRHRRLGARLLPELPEPAPRLSRRVVERGQLGRGRPQVRRGSVTGGARHRGAWHPTQSQVWRQVIVGPIAPR